MTTPQTDSLPVPFSYDEVPYESHSFAQTHPDHLAVLGRLFGMQPAPVERCRVLELGSASGGNILPAAFQLPDSQFVGLDLSARQIAHGQAVIDHLHLPNIELRHLNLMDIDRSLGTFDYIIAHGVYSWVPDAVQEKLLEVCDMLLAPQGIAYISYNTYPGWHYHGMVRDMMLYHTAGLTDPKARSSQARALLDFLAKSIPTDGNAYGITLKQEVERLRHAADSYLLHEHLEEVNEPVYFHQFMARASRHHMQYLAESDFSSMLTANFPPEVAQTLRPLANDIVRTEQYMDFLRNRAFRQTLLCRTAVPLHRNLTHQDVAPLQVASAARPVPDQPGQFTLAKGGTMTVGDPLTQQAFHYLSDIAPASVPFSDLVANAHERAGQSVTPASQEQLGANVLNCFTFNAVNLRTRCPQFVRQVSDKPCTTELVRYLAMQQERVTSELHESIKMDLLSRNVVMLLDGTRTVPQVVDALVARVVEGKLGVQKEGRAVVEAAESHAIMATQVEEMLPRLAQHALLVS